MSIEILFYDLSVLFSFHPTIIFSQQSEPILVVKVLIEL